jgi:hypothetical protein
LRHGRCSKFRCVSPLRFECWFSRSGWRFSARAGPQTASNSTRLRVFRDCVYDQLREGILIMGFPKYFVFGQCYTPVESFIRIDDAHTSKMVTPGAGEVLLRGTFSLEGCCRLAERGVLSECNHGEIELAVAAWKRLLRSGVNGTRFAI